MKGGIDMDFASFDSQEMPVADPDSKRSLFVGRGGWVVKPYTIYVNPYLVFNGDGYGMDTSPDRFTKHYYAGSERIASRLNREGQSATQHNPTYIYTTYDPDFPVLLDLQEVLPLFGLQPELDIEPAGYPPNPIEYEEDCQELFGNDQLEYERCLCLHFPATAAEQSIDCPRYEPIYWYHPDYLGHTDFVTDRTGQPYQHFFYAPFGEALLSQHTGTGYYNTPYRFNAKELDSETGLIYYGARYYMPKESVWMSVDPLGHKFPHQNAFIFVGDNPICKIDPDGKEENDIIVDNKGIVIKIVITDLPDRIFDEKGNRLFFNDPNFADKHMAEGLKIGDQVFNAISNQELISSVLDAGIRTFSFSAPSNLMNLGSIAIESYNKADFAEGYLAIKFNVSMGNSSTRRTNFPDNGAYFRFENDNTIYNLYDAGNFMWGSWMSLNGFSESVTTSAAHTNELITKFKLDTHADQKAIKNGYNYVKNK